MSPIRFEILMWSIAAGFTLFFVTVVVPPLIENPDVVGAFAAGFVNPYAAGYSVDVILCWAVLAGLILFDAQTSKIPYRWVCLCLGIVPGVAVGFALYLIARTRHLTERGN